MRRHYCVNGIISFSFFSFASPRVLRAFALKFRPRRLPRNPPLKTPAFTHKKTVKSALAESARSPTKPQFTVLLIANAAALTSKTLLPWQTNPSDSPTAFPVPGTWTTPAPPATFASTRPVPPSGFDLLAYNADETKVLFVKQPGTDGGIGRRAARDGNLPDQRHRQRRRIAQTRFPLPELAGGGPGAGENWRRHPVESPSVGPPLFCPFLFVGAAFLGLNLPNRVFWNDNLPPTGRLPNG